MNFDFFCHYQLYLFCLLILPKFFFLLSQFFTSSSLPLHLQSFVVCCYLLFLPFLPTLVTYCAYTGINT